jgi:hypothetical protein
VNTGERDTSRSATIGIGRIQSGCSMRAFSAWLIPLAGLVTSFAPSKVEGPNGSLNASWRRESGGGNTDQPNADSIRVSEEKAEHEKLNDERGQSPCQSVTARDGAEPGQLFWIRVGGSFCILAPEISPDVSGLQTSSHREV